MTCPACGGVAAQCDCNEEVSALLAMLGDLDGESALVPAAEHAVEIEAPAAPAPPAPAPVTPAPIAPPAGPALPDGEGWHPDPDRPGLLCWFDGVRWTESVRPALSPAQPWESPAAGPMLGVTDPGPSRLKRIVSITIAVALIVVGGVYFSNRTPSLYPTQWDPRVADLAAFVAAERGAAFKHPVNVEFLSVAEFKSRVGGGEQELSEEDRETLDQMTGALRAVGLVVGKVDLHQASKKLAEEGVVGLYNHEEKSILVRGDSLGVKARVTLVHELTHALQDQLYDLGKMRDKAERDDTAFTALVEADAMRIEDAYVETLSEAEQAEHDKDPSGDEAPDLAGIPEVLTKSLAFPYVFGPTFVEALLASDGTAALDRAFKSPPESEAEILDARRYLDGLPADDPDAPKLAKGDKVIDDSGGFGQAFMVQVLSPVVGFDRAWKVMKPWRGDSSAIFENASGTVCVAVSTRFDTPASATEFKGVVDSWAARTKATVSMDDRTVGLNVCDPGEAAPGLPKADPDPFSVLATRAAFISDFLDEQGVEMSFCAVDAIVEVLGAQTFMALSTIAEGSPEAESIGPRITSAAQRCATLASN